MKNQMIKLQAKPKLNKTRFQYLRKEQEGYYSFVSSKHPELGTLEMNKTSYAILILCTGTKTISEICKTLMKKYQNLDAVTIKNDVLTILLFFWRIGLIDWSNYHPYFDLYQRLNGEDKYNLLTEDEVITMLSEYNDSGLSLLYNSATFNNKIYLSQMIFNLRITFFKYSSENAQTVFAFRNDSYKPKSINLISVNTTNYCYPIETEFFNWVMKTISKLLNTNIYRIDYIDVSNTHNCKLIEKCGFSKIGKLHKYIHKDASYDAVYYSFVSGKE